MSPQAPVSLPPLSAEILQADVGDVRLTQRAALLLDSLAAPSGESFRKRSTRQSSRARVASARSCRQAGAGHHDTTQFEFGRLIRAWAWVLWALRLGDTCRRRSRAARLVEPRNSLPARKEREPVTDVRTGRTRALAAFDRGRRGNARRCGARHPCDGPRGGLVGDPVCARAGGTFRRPRVVPGSRAGRRGKPLRETARLVSGRLTARWHSRDGR